MRLTTGYQYYTTPHNLSFPSVSPLLKRRRSTTATSSSSRWAFMASAATSPSPTNTITPGPTLLHPRHHRRKDKIIVIMGATGTGKSRLSIDLATRYSPSEIINSDKMQVYKGLDITTNKIPLHERNNIPHHFLGEFDSRDGELTPSEFRHLAHLTISDIISRKKTPFLVGGSNSFIYSLLVEEYNAEMDVFYGNSISNSVSSSLRYNCCFLWVDASIPVLYDYLEKRVDDMLDSGMLQELTHFFNSKEELRKNSVIRTGLRKAIGLPEFEPYFRRYPPENGIGGQWDRVRRGIYEEAVREIKENTCELAKRQIGKILKLKEAGWDLRRLDATAAFKSLMTSSDKEECRSVWERQVLEPSVKIVKHFLEE